MDKLKPPIQSGPDTSARKTQPPSPPSPSRPPTPPSNPRLMPSVRDPLFTPRFAMLWVYAFVTFFAAFQLLPAIPFRILDLGGSKAEAGWVLSGYTFAGPFLAPVVGNLAGHFGPRRFLVTPSALVA